MKADFTQYKFWDPTLRSLIYWLEHSLDVQFTSTSEYRMGDDGVHGTLPLRAVDLRCRDDEFGNFLEGKINRAWVYDPQRLSMGCAKYHDSGGGKHLHIQVHPNTERVS